MEPIEFEWTQVPVALKSPKHVAAIAPLMYKVWKPGFPGLCAYGATLADAAVNLLNKHGE